MFAKKVHWIMVVHDDELVWLPARGGRCALRLPLQEVLAHGFAAERIPKGLKGNHRTLCIVPDHWFGMESYPFRSRKAGLIEPFLERKLAAAFPDLKDVGQFITYRHSNMAGEEEGINAYFLQDPKSFELYGALCKLNLCPQQITAPAFLWMEKLDRITPEFDRNGTLLIHLVGSGCLLYFYFNGSYLFSRNVILPEGSDYMDALTFEINQSLYMYSQKTKSDLNRFYLLGGAPDDIDAFGRALGREVIDIAPALDRSDTLEIDELHFLDGLLRPRDLGSGDSFLNVIHRHVRRELEWEPVQWAGICIGVMLLLPLIGVNLSLSRMLRTEAAEARVLYRQAQLSGGTSLAEAGNAIDQVLQAAERPQADDVVYRLLTCLPSGVRMKEIEVNLRDAPVVSLKAVVPAGDADHLKGVLTGLTDQVRRRFNTAQAFSINDIDVHADADSGDDGTSYVISLKLNLS
jgi:hypothetical protein